MNPKDDFIRHGGLMLFSLTIVNVCNLLFHLFMVRNLSTIDYGVLNSLVALFMIISVPSATIQTVIAKFVSKFSASNDLNKVAYLIIHLGKRLAIIAGLCFAPIILASPKIASFLQISIPQPIMLLGAALALAIIIPIIMGGLQGLERFGGFSFSMVSGSGIKLLLGILFVLAGFGVIGALGAMIIAGVFQLCIGIFILRELFGHKREKPYVDYVEIYKFFWPATLAQISFMVLTNADIVLVKHFFDPISAGHYSVASMVGKMILFLPGALAIVLFPKASKLHAKNLDPRHVLVKGLVLSGILCVLIAGIFLFYPNILIKLLAIKEIGIFLPLAKMFTIVMLFFAFTNIFLYYHLSIHNIRYIYFLVVMSVLQVLFIGIFHNSLIQVLYVLGFISVITALISFKITGVNWLKRSLS